MKNSEQVLITGANRGIGKSLVSVFSQNGHPVIATSRDLNTPFLEWCDITSNITGNSITPEFLALDDAAAAQNRAREIVTKNPQIKHFINNAAMAHGSTFFMTPIDVLKKVFEVNFFSTLAISQIFIKHLLKSGGGKLLNISSISTQFPMPGTLAYGSSKLALEHSTSVIAQELQNTPVSVGAIGLGLVDTEMLAKMDIKSQENLKNLSPKIEVLDSIIVAKEIYRFMTYLELNTSGIVRFVESISE
jgi:3-oxoacyl-[acyl-carrier protein] reductase